jgi:hypothetical protein
MQKAARARPSIRGAGRVRSTRSGPAELVREAVQMYLDGSSLYQVRDWLDERCMAPSGGVWTAAGISGMFHNPVLIGRRTDASGKTILRVEPILDRKTWDALQAKQSARAKATCAAPRSLLTGVAVCEVEYDDIIAWV